MADLWVIISAIVAVVMLLMASLFLGIWRRSRDRTAFWLAVIMLGPAINSFTVVWTIMHYWNPVVAAASNNPVRLAGFTMMFLCVMAGALGIFLLSDGQQTNSETDE